MPLVLFNPEVVECAARVEKLIPVALLKPPVRVANEGAFAKGDEKHDFGAVELLAEPPRVAFLDALGQEETLLVEGVVHSEQLAGHGGDGGELVAVGGSYNYVVGRVHVATLAVLGVVPMAMTP